MASGRSCAKWACRHSLYGVPEDQAFSTAGPRGKKRRHPSLSDSGDGEGNLRHRPVEAVRYVRTVTWCDAYGGRGWRGAALEAVAV
ncbi:hypothetical protein ERO13_D06G068433v2 [Gossypium hirsutum]|nr:hypothetical protein ERO13_D06G068433v2 [Gossypium hirsutum]